MTADPPEVHHVSYARLGTELDEDLLVLCSSCHAELHRHERRGDRLAREEAEWDETFGAFGVTETVYDHRAGVPVAEEETQ